jgi:hypothetical protein
MKLHLTILTLILLSITTGFSQNNNLQFNKALFSEINQTVSAYTEETTIGVISVPIGKIWKIERASLLGNFPCGVGITSFVSFQNLLTLGNLVIGLPGGFDGFFPVWLPEGNYQIHSNLIGVCNGYPFSLRFVYSGIEFNAVP